MSKNGKNSIKVLFDQKVIPNYRIGIFNRLAARPIIRLTVSYWTNRFDNEPPHFTENIRFNTVAFSPIHYSFRHKDYWFNKDLVIYILKNKPDVIIGPIGMFGIHPVVSKILEDLISLILGIRFVYRTSGGFLPGARHHVPPTGIRKLWFRILYRNVIVTTYTQRAAELIKKQGCPPEQVFVDYNSMDSEELLTIRTKLTQSEEEWMPKFITRYGIKKRGFVLFASRLYPEKRVDLLIDAWKYVIRQVPDVQLVVLGSGPARNSAIKQAKSISNRVIFVEGIYDTAELSKFYYLSDLVVFPGYATLSTHFAMCFGKAIISSQYGNEAEYVIDGVNGFKYDYGNINMLSQRIIKLLENKDLREKSGKVSEEIVNEKLNIENTINTIYKVIKLAAGMV